MGKFKKSKRYSLRLSWNRCLLFKKELKMHKACTIQWNFCGDDSKIWRNEDIKLIWVGRREQYYAVLKNKPSSSRNKGGEKELLSERKTKKN